MSSFFLCPLAVSFSRSPLASGLCSARGAVPAGGMAADRFVPAPWALLRLCCCRGDNAGRVCVVFFDLSKNSLSNMLLPEK